MFNSSNEVANRIKAYAIEKKVPLSSILKTAGLTESTMKNYRSSMPKADNLAKIAEALGCSIDYLMGRTDNPDVNH